MIKMQVLRNCKVNKIPLFINGYKEVVIKDINENEITFNFLLNKKTDHTVSLKKGLKILYTKRIFK